jgi:predicted exporter
MEEVLGRTEAMDGALRRLVDEEVLASYETPSRLLPSRARQDRARRVLASRLPPDRTGAIRRALAEAGFRLDPFEPTIRRIQEALRAGTPVTPDRLREAGMGPYLDRHLRETHGGFLGVIHLYPKANLWDGPTRAAWIERVRGILPPAGADLTGTVILSQSLADLVQEDFLRAAALALLVIAVIASVHFRRPMPVALSLVPVALGAIWMIAGMAILGIDLNYMNIIIYPMVFGLGVDDGIHLVHRHREDRPGPEVLLRGTGRAILLTSLTTLLGFGSLTLAHHRGVASLGQTSLIGITACLGTSLFLLPALLVLLQGRSR